MSPAPLFRRVALIGIGLIGSSLARVMLREGDLAGEIVASARTEATLATVMRLGIAHRVEADPARAVEGADLVILGAPVGAYAGIMEKIHKHLAPGAILSDVGSTKQSVVRDVGPLVPAGVHFVPAHPIAGTEHSGPEAGFAELFQGRWCILTPPPGTDEAAVEKLATLWRRAGSNVETMEPTHHDRVLAITSHLPHLIAWTIVGTAADLAEDTKQQVLKFSASGFRDFTRIAASDPVMWRDIFLNNREAVLEMVQRFAEDLSVLQRAIRWGEGDVLMEKFSRGRAIRRGVIDAKQA
ncbi:MAG: prephenate/arogenate dehydrogenase family protein [Alphaproteobacteria bacterium]|nr:prephenate/arogenate dehydrogenase family protein [Alphaproteobacteria bacterium]